MRVVFVLQTTCGELYRLSHPTDDIEAVLAAVDIVGEVFLQITGVQDLQSCAQSHAVDTCAWAATQISLFVFALGGSSEVEAARASGRVARFTEWARGVFRRGETVAELRQRYVSAVLALRDQAAAWRQAGADVEFIAKEMWADRRALGIQYKFLTPPEKLAEIMSRNTQAYGDPYGPTIEYLRANGKTWEEIIESASRPRGADLGF